MAKSTFAGRACLALCSALFTGMVGGVMTTEAMAQAAPAPVFAPVIETLEVKGEVSSRQPAPVSTPRTYALRAPLGQGYLDEVEPNGTIASASPISSGDAVVRANLFPATDVDFYSFTAAAGDRIHAAVMTAASAGNSSDSQLTLLASDGTTVIEFDDDNGTFAGFSSSIAGAVIPANGTYYLRVNDFSAASGTQSGYELHFRVQSGAPTPEVEPNDTPATANVLPANGWVSGVRTPASATEQDWYQMNLNAGDTVFLSLDLDPERDATSWNGRLGIALFGDAGNQILVADDAGTVDSLPSEALFMTVKDAGTYFAFVDSASAAVGGPTATYRLSVSIRPNVNEGVNCTTYTSTNVPQTIGPGAGLVSSTITVPGNPRVADVDVLLQLNHAQMNEIDAHLRSPAGQDLGLFTDIGAAATGGQTQMDLWLDDEAGVPPTFTVLRGMRYKPENNPTGGTANTSGAYRLSWFDGINAGGTWTLDLRDDLVNGNGGTLTGWALRICEAPPPPTCPAGTSVTTVYTTDFEADAGGFTSSGTANEWERGLPATGASTTANPIASFNSCNSGNNCFKTDLDNTYDASSNQNLLSPNINLAGIQPPIVVSWAQRHQVETANFDQYFVDFQQVGGGNPVRLYQWLDPTPISASSGTGNPQVNIGGAVGWGVLSRRADSLAGQNAELRFNLSSDSSVQLGGVAIDDVTVTGCRSASADLSITKTDGAATEVPGTPVTYTIVASNAGPDPVTGATVADTFAATLTGCTWTCTGAGGGTCTAAGSGNINDTAVNLPVGGTATYSATCTVAASATGLLNNTATVSSALPDPTPGNNAATDTNTLTPQADLGITKTNGVTSVSPGNNTTYTIVASNAGPSNAPGSTVADTFPAACTSVNWTCSGAGGGTCTAAGSGNINDVVNLPAGGSVTYLAVCAVSGVAVGSLSNTATVAAPGSVTDSNPANNSATDTDTIQALTADVSITKTDGQASDIPGTTISYTIVASNAGPAAASATIADTFAATLTGVTWTCVGAGGGTCTANGSGNINDSANLPNGGSVTYTVNATIAASATGTLSNTATATVGSVTDPNPANNSATDTTTLTPQADLAITLTDTPDPVIAGTGQITYLATITNGGPSDAQAVGLSLPMAAGTTFVSAVASAGGSCTTPAVGANGTVNCSWAGATAPGAGNARTATVIVGVPASATGVLSVTGTASTSTTDPTSANNTVTTTTTVNASADLAITLTDTPDPVIAGNNITYAVTVTNNGPSDAQAAGFSLPLPAATTFVSLTATGGTCTNPAVGSGGTVSCTWAGATAPTVSRTATVVARVLPSTAAGNISATATTATTTTDPTAANNTATATTAVQVSADLSMTLAVVPTQGPTGTLVNVTATVTNNGPSDAQNVQAAVTLPQPVNIVSSSGGAGGTCATTGSGANNIVTCTWSGATAPTATRVATIQAVIALNASGVITAVASSPTTDPATPNNTTTASISGVPVVQAIPTTDRIGLILLSGLLLGLGIVAVRRQ